MLTLGRGLSLSSYRREWLVRDIVAGVVLTTLLVPQGMAYAELAGLADWLAAVSGIDRQVPSTILTRRPSQSCWLVTWRSSCSATWVPICWSTLSSSRARA